MNHRAWDLQKKSLGAEQTHETLEDEAITDPDMFCPMCGLVLNAYDNECEGCGWSFARHVQRQK